MCEHCAPSFDRRALLRRGLIAGSVVATAPLWNAVGALAGSTSSGVETIAMGEDSVAMAGAARVAGSRRIPAPNLTALAAPNVVSRRQWGADESIRVNDRLYAPVRKLIVHHTASANKPRNPADVVRFIQRYNTVDRKFSDTGYNFIVDHKGVIYEGRAARRYSSGEAITGEDARGWGVVGAHAKHNNAGSCGVCLIGDFDNASPTDAAVNSLVSIMAWQASRHRIDAQASDPYIDTHGLQRRFPNISGHRQVGPTLCPGRRLFALLPTLRSEIDKQAGAWAPFTVDVPAVIRHETGPLRALHTQ